MNSAMKNTTCWIDTIPESDADSELSAIYDRVRGPNGQLDNLYQAFSLRSHTILPADDLYLAAMHHEDNILPKVFSELIGTYVAILSGCQYAETHHGHNFAYLTADPHRSDEVLRALRENDLQACGSDRDVAALVYVRQLCLSPETVTQSNVSSLQSHGWTDGEILEIVQVVAMFSYFVRVINGVGISLGDEKPGLY